jgi:hypothetical protein
MMAKTNSEKKHLNPGTHICFCSGVQFEIFFLPLVLSPVRATSNYEGTNLRLARII